MQLRGSSRRRSELLHRASDRQRGRVVRWVRYRFGDNAELMGAWNSARNEVGPSKSHVQPDAGTPETPTEVQPNEVKSAA